MIDSMTTLFYIIYFDSISLLNLKSGKHYYNVIKIHIKIFLEFKLLSNPLIVII
jgi:hypothetical protein